MRILLTSNASYAPPRGGSTRSNLVWLEHLAANGHECLVVCAAIQPNASPADINGIRIVPVHEFARNSSVLREQIHEFRPDWVLVSSEDVSHVLLREAHHAAPGRIVYLAHTPQFYPFGPASWNPDPRATEIVRQSQAVVAIGRHTAGYIQRHAGRSAAVVHPPIYGREPYAEYGGFERGSILMINPCVVKGITIFLALAKHFPRYLFTALAGWGTTREDRAALSGLPNVRIVDSVPDIEDVLSEARLLLMPSLWYEGFGLIAMEAMLRGLPVISSDSGGLVEAKQGTGFVIPVRPIQQYEAVFDENLMPKPVGVEQNITPWIEALSTLLSNRDVYEAEAARSRTAALEFVRALDAADFEKLLLSLTPQEVADNQAIGQSPDPRLAHLSPAKRTLLLQRLRHGPPK
jgi:glycosyltransferase involved in cell wall biosynthesis